MTVVAPVRRAGTLVPVGASAIRLAAAGRPSEEQLATLAALIARHAPGGERTAIDGVLVSAFDAPTEPMASTTGTVFALVAQGAKRLGLGDRVYDYRAGQYLVASIDLPITGHFTEASPEAPALGFGLVLRPASIAALLLDAGLAGPAAARRGRGPAPPALGVADASSELVDAAIRMLRLLDAPADRPVLAPAVEREILWRLVTGPLGEAVRQIGLADSSLTHISRAVRRISARFDEAFRVEDLAHDCGMSASAFHRSFLAATGSSPLQFQKRIRLQQARLMLMTGVDDVATIGYRVGYESASQFNREYRRRFGRPPGQDAALLRGER